MKTSEKLTILADAAKYDASCSSSGSSRSNTAGGIGSAAMSGICHSWSADGRCISLLKILLSNDCIFDCAYCLSRRSNTLPRATFTAEEVADLTINFYLRNYIEGLFLSSAVYGSPDRTMADMVDVCRLLRKKHRFNGYIHLKVIPGSSPELVRQAGFLADRLSVNIELPSEQSLKMLAPQKTKRTIMVPMQQIGEEYSGFQRDRMKSRNVPCFCPAGQSTQMIVGASAESDLQILTLTENLYTRMQLKRVYYSAYMAVNTSPNLPALTSGPPLVREHRLYQADWLLRFYRFQAHEILSAAHPFLDDRLDPKVAWALRNFDLFPIDINRASYEELLRVPGIGVTSARRIIATRRLCAIREEDLKKIGLVVKRARHFITIGGKYLGDHTMSHQQLVGAMRSAEKPGSIKLLRETRQLRLF
ncbi:putative DNA modification/repair radical SAM protein [Desulfopila aestuarii]|uniref:Putative DNA modification/repair radical SAM protein n=1 Tax=Desulfopila aestuarii DSM 18488 TaxID=1121416 RepID=A0A1M7XVZ6_9BACT|nr:putative DNA modification/repair radical SAM protein [Desulfopila aestuarii]SHO42876.1 putative DNA modification/repair radical SAM protein [Desulfopila aestuarii DSM 18488]